MTTENYFNKPVLTAEKQEEIENHVSRFRANIYNSLDDLEVLFEKIMGELDMERQKKFIRMLLKLLLFVACTKEGKSLIKILINPTWQKFPLKRRAI
jgi:hypothetical protein